MGEGVRVDGDVAQRGCGVCAHPCVREGGVQQVGLAVVVGSGSFGFEGAATAPVRARRA